MGRCEDFYNKWRRDPNWCEKSPGAVSQINSYIGFIDQLEAEGIPQSFVVENLREGAARPLLAIKDPVVKDAVLAKVKSSLKAKKETSGSGGITAGDVKSIISSVSVAKEPSRANTPMFPLKPKITVDRAALLGAKIIEWEFPHSITVEKGKKKYEINFDAITGNMEIVEV